MRSCESGAGRGERREGEGRGGARRAGVGDGVSVAMGGSREGCRDGEGVGHRAGCRHVSGATDLLESSPGTHCLPDLKRFHVLRHLPTLRKLLVHTLEVDLDHKVHNAHIVVRAGGRSGAQRAREEAIRCERGNACRIDYAAEVT